MTQTNSETKTPSSDDNICSVFRQGIKSPQQCGMPAHPQLKYVCGDCASDVIARYGREEAKQLFNEKTLLSILPGVRVQPNGHIKGSMMQQFEWGDA